MANTATVAEPTSRKKLRLIATKLREKLNLQNEKYFPIMGFLEIIMPKLDVDFHLEILSKYIMGNCHGKACPEEKVIYIREDVYEGACDDRGRDRFTIAHEIGHYLLHTPGTVSYARIESGKRIEAYRDPEWQANTLAAEILMPYDLIKNMDYRDIAIDCAVSFEAAKVQKKITLQ